MKELICKTQTTLKNLKGFRSSDFLFRFTKDEKLLIFFDGCLYSISNICSVWILYFFYGLHILERDKNKVIHIKILRILSKKINRKLASFLGEEEEAAPSNQYFYNPCKMSYRNEKVKDQIESFSLQYVRKDNKAVLFMVMNVFKAKFVLI